MPWLKTSQLRKKYGEENLGHLVGASSVFSTGIDEENPYLIRVERKNLHEFTDWSLEVPVGGVIFSD